MKSKGRRQMVMAESSGSNERVACEVNEERNRKLDRAANNNGIFHKTEKTTTKILTLSIDVQGTIHNGVYDKSKTNRDYDCESQCGHEARCHELKSRKVAKNDVHCNHKHRLTKDYP